MTIFILLFFFWVFLIIKKVLSLEKSLIKIISIFENLWYYIDYNDDSIVFSWLFEGIIILILGYYINLQVLLFWLYKHLSEKNSSIYNGFILCLLIDKIVFYVPDKIDVYIKIWTNFLWKLIKLNKIKACITFLIKFNDINIFYYWINLYIILFQFTYK